MVVLHRQSAGVRRPSLLYLAHLALTGSEDDAEPTYWEGAVTYSGSATGVGYLEMTGYGKPPKLHEKL
jgi:hypothetical protein